MNGRVVRLIKRFVPVVVIRIYGRLLYSGYKVECPICGARYRKFAPYGVAKRYNALCLNCLALERHRLLWLYLNERTNLFDGEKTLLHFAPERALYRRFSNSSLHYFPADLHPELYRYGSGVQILKMDITAIPLETDSVDVILANHVLEHISNDALAMKELLRVLKPDGWAILQVPVDVTLPHTYEDSTITDPRQREQHFGQSDHVRIYGQDYVERLERAGFIVVRDEWAKTLTDGIVRRYALPKDETIFLCKKRVEHINIS